MAEAGLAGTEAEVGLVGLGISFALFAVEAIKLRFRSGMRDLILAFFKTAGLFVGETGLVGGGGIPVGV